MVYPGMTAADSNSDSQPMALIPKAEAEGSDSGSDSDSDSDSSFDDDVPTRRVCTKTLIGGVVVSAAAVAGAGLGVWCHFSKEKGQEEKTELRKNLKTELGKNTGPEKKVPENLKTEPKGKTEGEKQCLAHISEKCLGSNGSDSGEFGQTEGYQKAEAFLDNCQKHSEEIYKKFSFDDSDVVVGECHRMLCLTVETGKAVEFSTQYGNISCNLNTGESVSTGTISGWNGQE